MIQGISSNYFRIDQIYKSVLKISLKNINLLEKNGEVISDIHDGKIYKKLQKLIPSVFTFNHGSDGPSLLKAAKKSDWPTDLYLKQTPARNTFSLF